MNYLLIMFALMIQQIISSCNSGCLRCSKTDVCLMCDFTKFYYLSEGLCVQSRVENCMMISFSGQCIACNQGFILDSVGNLCIDLPANKVISHCIIQMDQNKCMKCISGYFVNRGVCFYSYKIVDNCLDYSKDGICSLCKKDYLLYPDGKCHKFSSLPKCLIHGFTKCESCKSGYMINKNLAAYIVTNLTNSQQVDQYLNSEFDFTIEFPECEKLQVPNCKKFKEANFCLECENGHFLELDGQCKKNPDAKIANCHIYANEKSCVSCGNGFYLADSTSCLPVIEIHNCLIFNGSAPKSECLLCEKKYKLDNSGCEDRSNYPIRNCFIYQPRSESCQECDIGHIPNQSGQLCGKEIAFCVEHNKWNFLAQISCEKCVSGFYFQNGACVSGKIDFCKDYMSPNKCRECIQGYYLSGTTCFRHKFIKDCEIYSTTKNSCKQCNSRSILFNKSNSCLSVRKISGCTQYNDEQKCKKCKKGKYVSLNGELCLPIPSEISELCLEFSADKNKCIKCKKGLTLDQDGSCLDPIDIISENCAPEQFQSVFENALQSEYTVCEICDSFKTPFPVSNLTFCLDWRDLDMFNILETDTNCIKYSEKGCLQCKSNFVLKVDGTCGICQSSESILFYDSFTKKKHVCQQLNFTGCKFHIQNNPNSEFVCVAPKENYVAVVHEWNSTNPFPIGSTSLGYSIIGYLLPVWRPMPVYTKTLIYVSGCLLYSTIDSITGCIKCQTGFSGPTDFLGFVKNCSPVSFCLKNEVGGLSPNITAFLSCSQCQIGSIPDIKMQIIDFNNWPTLSKNLNSEVVSCSQNFEFVNFIGDNCAISITSAGLSSTKGAFCIACKNGFYPIKDGWMVRSCLPIPNCAGNPNYSVYNLCGDCILQQNTQTAWKLLANLQSPNYSACTISNTNNCLFTDAKSECVICRASHFLNLDRICEPISIPSCHSEASNQPIHLSDSSIVFALAAFGIIDGCTVCKKGFVQFQTSVQISFCLNSTYLLSGQLTLKTKFVRNCEAYFNKFSVLLCFKCYPGFIPTVDFTRCVPSLPECLYADNNSEFLCASCQKEYAPNNGNCQRTTVPNCFKYSSSLSNSTNLQCSQCDSGFVLEINTCVEGNVDYCSEYFRNNPNSCLKCFPGYIPLITNGNTDYCLNIKESGYCESVDLKTLFSKYFKCIECLSIGQNTYYPSKILDPDDTTNFCLPVNLISNCAKYNIEEEFKESKFICEKCAEGYWLDKSENECKIRLKQPFFCVQFFVEKDSCIECQENHVLSEDKTFCEPIPSGIYGCIEYLDSVTCLKCKPNMFLSRNLCKIVNRLIDNCEFYSSTMNCLSCLRGYFKNSFSKCIKTTAENCETYQLPEQCATCKTGTVFVNVEGKTICSKVDNSNCIVSSSYFPFSCEECAENYFPKKGKCEKLLRKIPGCERYSSEFTCKVCDDKTILTPNKKQCIDESSLPLQRDPNCQNFVMTSEPICKLCETGYFLDVDGNCNAFLNKPDFFDHCLMIDPIHTGVCLICMPNYYMDNKGDCFLSNISNSTYTNPIWYTNSAVILSYGFISMLCFFLKFE